MATEQAWQVLLFYTYVYIEEPQVLADTVKLLAQKNSLLGRVILAHEGINATLEGTVEATEKFVKTFLADGRLVDVRVKRSKSLGKSFPKLSVKVRQEIVGTHFAPEEADPRVETAPHISPEELKQWYTEGKDFVVVDMRNDYEFASGHFKNAIEPGIGNSRELPEKLQVLEPLKDKTVLTVCTGGVRCEKMSAYLMHKGFREVYQLQDGIHGYMEKYPGEDFLGTLYTFDERLTMDFGGNREVIGICRLCGAKTERYVNCAKNTCHLHFLVCTNCVPREEAAYCKDECRIAA